ncbi:MAG: CRTAC1 family protein [Melioribacteraceae bacterium]
MKKLSYILLCMGITLNNIIAQNPYSSATILPGSDMNMSQAVVFGDYDNDGWTDIYLTRGHDGNGTKYVNFLYKNISGTLSKQTIAGITDILEASISATLGDFNNDGWLDLYVANAQPGPNQAKPRNNLLINSGGGSFINQTNNNSYGPIVSNLEDARHVSWGDYNNDGFVDVFVKRGKITIAGQAQEYSSFFENTSGTSSVQKTEAQIGAIVTTAGTVYNSLGATFGWCDFNNDGYLDIYSVKGYGKDNTLWKNSSGFFTDVTTTALRPLPCTTEGYSWGDFDNDGDFDLFTGTKPEATILHSFLFRNNSTPSSTDFVDITSSNGGTIFTNEYFVRGSSFIDVDNDGDLDLFTATSSWTNISSPPSILYQNSGATGGFIFSQLQQIDLNPGNGNPDSEARGAAFADIDNDGYIDMIVAREGEPLLYMNNKTGNNFSLIKLVGTGTTNKSAIGSRVLISSNIPEQGGVTSQIREISGQTGFAGQNDLRAHFGLGTAAKINEVKAQWLNSTGGSTRQENVYTDLPTNKFIVFTQGNLNVTASVIKAQNFMYLFGNTGGSVEFTIADTDGGNLTMLRTNSDPAGTFSGTTATSPDGSMIIASAVYPDRYWTITQNNVTGFNSTVYFDASNLSGSPNLDKVVLMKRANSGSVWTPLNTNKIGNTLYATGVNSFSEFGIGYQENGIYISAKIFLEGSYDAANNNMRDDINSSILLTSPYSEDPRTVSDVPANIVDWVLVELRTSANGSAVASKSAFLRNDGKIVADDGTTEYIEIDAAVGDYYIVVKHRNHLTVMSTDPVHVDNIQSLLIEIVN